MRALFAAAVILALVGKSGDVSGQIATHMTNSIELCQNIDGRYRLDLYRGIREFVGPNRLRV